MITVLAGKNSYERSSRQQKLVDEFVAAYTDIGLQKIDGEESDYDTIREALESLPFLASKKLVVLRNPSANKQFLENYQSLLEDTPEATDVLVVETKPDKRTSYYKYLKKLPGFAVCEDLHEQQLVGWVVQEAKRQQGSITNGDARYLVGRVGTDQTMLANEIAKLISYQSEVTKQVINLLTEPTPKSSIFDLLEAAFAGNKQTTMRLYEEQRRLKVEPQQIIAMLAWQLHVLITIAAADGMSDQSIAKHAKINPFVVGKSKGLAIKLGVKNLQTLIAELLQLDELSKTTAIDTDVALRRYLLTIS